MTAGRRGAERGGALVITLAVLACLSGLGLGLVATATAERAVAAHARAASATMVAAGAAVEAALGELSGWDSWSAALDGARPSAFRDATVWPVTPTRLTLDLGALTVALQDDTRSRYAAGPNAPVWRLFRWGRLATLAGVPDTVTRGYVAVWVADDPWDGDDLPLEDANGTVMLHGEAFGDAGTRRATDAVIARSEGGVRVLSWRES